MKHYGKIVAIHAIWKEVTLVFLEHSVLLELYESVFLSSLLFNCQSWANLRKSNDIEALTAIQLKYLKQMMRVAYSTSKAGVYLELGTLLIVNEIEIREIKFLHHILSLKNDGCFKKIKSIVKSAFWRKIG